MFLYQLSYCFIVGIIKVNEAAILLKLQILTLYSSDIKIKSMFPYDKTRLFKPPKDFEFSDPDRHQRIENKNLSSLEKYPDFQE